MFHFGVLFVLLGHIGGLLIPESWTEAVGVSEHKYHLMAVFVGTIAGLCTLIGMAILIARRRLTGPVFAATTKNDKAMYVVLAAVIVLGL
jgi:nitrate reductase gamma subunit